MEIRLFTLLPDSHRKRIQTCILDFSFQFNKTEKEILLYTYSLAQSFTNVESAPCVLRSSMPRTIRSLEYDESSVGNIFFFLGGRGRVWVKTSYSVEIYFWNRFRSFSSKCFRIFLFSLAHRKGLYVFFFF